MENCGPANYPIQFYKNVNINETDQNSAKEKVKLTISLEFKMGIFIIIYK